MSEETVNDLTPNGAEEVNVDQQQEKVAPSLGVADLADLARIVDAAVSRGAFKAAEAEGVGKVYNKLVAFLQSVTPQQKPAEETEAPAQASE